MLGDGRTGRALTRAVMLAAAALALLGAAPARAEQSIAIDGTSPGRVFDGVGGLSAGASSRLLIDYPEPERSRILDYLFKPGYGAALDNLDVEIGGDTNSTDGAEPSHMRTPDDLDCNRGYEWWLMEEAVERNPDIILGAREWGAPGWVGEDDVWTDRNIDYYLAWLGCAKRHGLHIGYLGGWNETGHDRDWYVKFRRALDAHGYDDIRIVADDDLSWDIADDLANDPEFADAVDVVGVHYPCGRPFSDYARCPSSDTAIGLDKPLWASEQGSQPFDFGAAPLARALNRQYLDGRMTGTVNWALTASWYTSLSFSGAGLMRAYQPWSGYYEPSQSLWAIAHTTQFTEPGWRYLDTASGRLDGGGTYVTLRSPSTGDYSTVVETLDATEPQTLELSVGGGLSDGTVHVWSSDLGSPRIADWFEHTGDVTPRGGAYAVTLQPGRVYTLSTTTGQGRGTARAPRDRPFPMPYSERFDGTPLGRSPRFFSDVNGAFEAARCPAGRDGRCLEQVITTPPIPWRYGSVTPPMTLVGDPNWWGDYSVRVDARLGEADHVELLARIDGQRQVGGAAAGYHLRLAADGAWRLYREGWDSRDVTLADGRPARFDAGAWHRLGLRMRGTRIEVRIDGERLATVADDHHDRGQVGLVASAWDRASFDDLVVRRTGPWPRLLANEDMTATATSAGFGYDAGNVLDDDAGSLWHSSWDAPAPLPQAITLDLGARRRVRTLVYQPRYDEVPNGIVTGYRVLVGDDGRGFREVAAGAWPLDRTTKTATFPATRARYLRLEATSGGGGFASAAEIGVSRDAYRLPRPYAARGDLEIGAPAVIGAGQTQEVTVAFHNRGEDAARDVAVELRAPDGWAVRPTSSTAFRRVAAGETATATFDVTPPAGAESATLGARASYRYGGRLTTREERTVMVRTAPSGDTWVSDLDWISATNGYGPPERDTSNGERPAGDGHTITIGGATYAKGIGAHAYSKISYYLGGRCTRLTADVGVDDEVGDAGSVDFEVWADGRRVLQTPVLRGPDAALPITADIAGAKVVDLVVDYGGDGGISDHADWGDAKLACA